MPDLRLFDNRHSENGYKCRLLLHLLDIPFERVEVDIYRGESRKPDFLARNPNGRIPLLEIEPGRYLAESSAILFYLAEGSPFLPQEPWERALALQWMCFEQYNHEPNIATSRNWLLHFEIDEEKRGALAIKHQAGHAALSVMEGHLAGQSYFVGERQSIADIALYAYTHVADQGGFDLGAYPHIRDWLARVAGHPRHVPDSVL